MYQGKNIREQSIIFFKLLIPVLIYQIISYSSSMIGTFMAGHYSPEDLSGISMGVNIWNPIMYGLNAIVLAIVPIVSQLLGKGQEAIIPTKVRQFLYVALVIGVLLIGVLNFILVPVVDTLGLPNEISSITKKFLFYESFGVVQIFLYVVLRAFMDSLGLTRLSMIMMIISVPINVFFAYALIFGKFGFPELGGAGNALAVVFTYSILLVIAIIIVLKHPEINKYNIFKVEKIMFSHWVEIFKIGTPMALASVLESVVFSTLSIMVSRFGTITIASHQAALNFAGFVYSLPLSVANALTIVVAYHVGAKNIKFAKRYTMIGIGIGLIVSIAAGLMIWLLNGLIPYLYTTDEAVVQLTSILLLYSIGFSVCDSFASALAGVLRAYKKVISICISMIIGYYVVGVPLAYYLINNTDLGVYGLWIGWIVGLLIYALLVLIYYLKISKKYRVIIANN